MDAQCTPDSMLRTGAEAGRRQRHSHGASIWKGGGDLRQNKQTE